MSVMIQSQVKPEPQLVRRDPSSSVSCLPGFSWANDAPGNSPCFVAAAVVGACSSSNYTVPPLKPGNNYNTPGESGQLVDVCTCSWAAYNLISACTACQPNVDILPWVRYSTNCTESLLSNTTYYPSDVPTLDNTSIPFYATTNPGSWQGATFNVGQAQNISEQGHPDVYGAPIPSSTPSKHTSNAAAIGGGVTGGVVFLLIGAAVVWIMRKRSHRRNGKPRDLNSTAYSQGHTRSYSDLSKSNLGDSSFGGNGYMSVGMMQQPGFSPSPFASASNMVSVNSFGAYSPPPSQPGFRLDSPPSAYHRATSPPISRFNSPSPSMQLLNRSQSPDSSRLNATFGNDMSVQPFMLPSLSTSPPPLATKHREATYDTPAPREESQGSVAYNDHDNTSSPARRVNPPAYEDVALSDSRDAAAQRRESHGTDHVSRPPLGEKQPSQISQATQSSQGSSIRTTPASNPHEGLELAAIDAFVGQIA